MGMLLSLWVPAATGPCCLQRLFGRDGLAGIVRMEEWTQAQRHGAGAAAAKRAQPPTGPAEQPDERRYE